MLLTELCNMSLATPSPKLVNQARYSQHSQKIWRAFARFLLHKLPESSHNTIGILVSRMVYSPRIPGFVTNCNHCKKAEITVLIFSDFLTKRHKGYVGRVLKS